MYSYNKEVRAALRAHPDGLTTSQLHELIKAPDGRMRAVLRSMPDAYIDRWQTRGDKKYLSAVWCVVEVPDNCPRPDKSGTKHLNSVKKGV
jgi:hypothetical protein